MVGVRCWCDRALGYSRVWPARRTHRSRHTVEARRRSVIASRAERHAFQVTGCPQRAMLETCGPSWEGRTFPLIE